MKAEELNTKTPDELNKLLLETKKEQFNLRFQRSNGTLDNTSQIRKARRLVARIKTMLNKPVAEKPAPKKTAKKTTKKTAKKAA